VGGLAPYLNRGRFAGAAVARYLDRLKNVMERHIGLLGLDDRLELLPEVEVGVASVTGPEVTGLDELAPNSTDDRTAWDRSSTKNPIPCKPSPVLSNTSRHTAGKSLGCMSSM